MSRFRSGLLLIFAALAWSGAPAQAPDCTLPNLCFWVDDNTCGRCLDGGGAPTATTCIGPGDGACLGIGNGLCGGSCANDRNVPCTSDLDCNAVGGVCSNIGLGTDPGTGGEPYCRIQRAYDGAKQTTTRDDVHTIVVREGTYQECVKASGFVELSGQWDPSSEDRPVKIVAEDFLLNGRNDRTVIDGGGTCEGFTTKSTVEFGGTGAVLSGFTIQGGVRSGVFAQGAVSITNNVIRGNQSELGGGVYLVTASCYYSQVDPVNVEALIADNVIEDNHSIAPDQTGVLGCEVCVQGVAPCGTGSGGGIFAAADDRTGCGTTDDVEIRGNTILNNTVENFNFDPCSAECTLSGAACDELGSPGGCPDGEGDCVGTLPYTANGGGIYATTSSVATRSASVVVTQNLIAGNSMTANSPTNFSEGYGGGIYAVSFGYGTDTIEVSDNCVGGADLANCTSDAQSGNSATLDGGGIAARARPLKDGRHTIAIHGNTVTGNTADRDGGGLELLTEATDLVQSIPAGDFVRLTMTDNLVSDNASGRDGGGLKAVSDIRRTTLADAAELTHLIHGNVLQNNTSFLGGAGAILLPIADADDFNDPVCGPLGAPAESRIDFTRNLVVDNVATATGGLCFDSGRTCLIDADCEAVLPGDFCELADVIGGGVLTLPLTFGDAIATVMIDQTTVAGNTIGPNGFVGGIEAQALTYPDCLTGFDLGASRLLIDRTIVAGNNCPTSQQCIGVGGPPAVQDILISAATSSNVFGHNPNYEASLFPTDPPPGNVTGNPQLAASTYFPDACSPVFAGFCHGDLAPCDDDGDCIGSRSCSVESDSPLAACNVDTDCPGGACITRCVQAVGFYANPDSTGDGAIDGQEILGIAASFGAEDGVDNRFDPAYDINGNGENDGVDLSFFTAEFGQVCPP